MSRKGFLGYYGAWFTPNGRSYYKKPRKLYEQSWDYGDPRDAWCASGNESIPEDQLGDFGITEFGVVHFSSEDRGAVELAIDVAENIRLGFLRANGLKDADDEV